MTDFAHKTALEIAMDMRFWTAGQWAEAYLACDAQPHLGLLIQAAGDARVLRERRSSGSSKAMIQAAQAFRSIR